MRGVGRVLGGMCFDTGRAILMGGTGRSLFIGSETSNTHSRPDDRQHAPRHIKYNHSSRSLHASSLSHITRSRWHAPHAGARNTTPLISHQHSLSHIYRRSSALLAATLAPRCPSSCPTTGGPRIGCPAGGDGPLWLITLPGLSTDISSLACSLAAAAAAARCA